MAMALGPNSTNPGIASSMAPSQPLEQTWDAVETYFECITTCSLDDGECITRCVEELRDSDED